MRDTLSKVSIWAEDNSLSILRWIGAGCVIAYGVAVCLSLMSGIDNASKDREAIMSEFNSCVDQGYTVKLESGIVVDAWDTEEIDVVGYNHDKKTVYIRN